MDVLRTFAESEARSRRSLLSRRGVHTCPGGRIHAAEQQATTTLCGRPTGNLFEFGRSRYPFERTPTHARCPTCNLLAGTPTWTEARPDTLGHPAFGGSVVRPVEGHPPSIGRHALSAESPEFEPEQPERMFDTLEHRRNGPPTGGPGGERN